MSVRVNRFYTFIFTAVHSDNKDFFYLLPFYSNVLL